MFINSYILSFFFILWERRSFPWPLVNYNPPSNYLRPPSPCASFIHLPGRGASVRAMRVEDKKRKKGQPYKNVQQRSEAMSTAVASARFYAQSHHHVQKNSTKNSTFLLQKNKLSSQNVTPPASLFSCSISMGFKTDGS